MKKMVAVNEEGRRIGEDHPRAKLTDQQVDLVRTMHEDEGLCYRAISKKLGIPKSTVQMICQYTRRNSTVARWKIIERPTPVES